METVTPLEFKMTVGEVLSNWPDTYSVFASLKTKCIGCLLQRFCTLVDVADIYQIPLKDLTGELKKYIPTLKGALHE